MFESSHVEDSISVGVSRLGTSDLVVICLSLVKTVL